MIEVNDIMEILQQHYGPYWEKRWGKIKKYVKKEYKLPLKKRKKRRIELQRRATPSFVSDVINGESEMHAAWNADSPGQTLRSTIRSSQRVSDNLEFQQILNEEENTMRIHEGVENIAIDKTLSLPELSTLNDIEEIESVKFFFFSS